MSRRALTLALAGVVVALGYLIYSPHRARRTSEPMRQAAYVWQRAWDDPVRDAVFEHQGSFSEMVVLAAEVNWLGKSPQAVHVPIDYSVLIQLKTPVGIALRIGPFGGSFGAREESTIWLSRFARSLVDEATTNHLAVAELQIDFDCAESKLDGYRAWVAAIREQVAPVPVVITALPAWLRHSAFRSLVANSDGYVLQVHSLARPRSLDSPFNLCDPDAARRSVERAALLGKPFRVALPTYGYLLAFDAEARFAGLSAEGPARAWPTNYAMREVRAEPAAMAGLVRDWATNRPAAMRGLIWYRLPVDGDRINWRWPTLAAVMDGKAPQASVRVEKREPQPGLVELALVNEGQGDFTMPVKVTLRWTNARIVASDAFLGFEVAQTSTNLVGYASTAEYRPDRARGTQAFGLGAAGQGSGDDSGNGFRKTMTTKRSVNDSKSETRNSEVEGRERVEIQEAIAEIRISRQKAQKSQRQGMVPSILCLLRLFAATLGIASRRPKSAATSKVQGHWVGVSVGGPSKAMACMVLMASLLASRALACGPFFPNTLLDRGDAAIRTAPEAVFRDELDRMKLVVTSLHAQPTEDPPLATLDAELADLRASLSRAGVPDEAQERIVQQHRHERLKIETFALGADGSTDASGSLRHSTELSALRPDTNSLRLPNGLPQAVAGLPAEFADYLRGSVAWHQGDLPGARRAWSDLLARPPAERHFKSTWAAYMLGKSWEQEDHRRACQYFQTVRKLATNGFSDSLGLAAASLGWEARCHYLEREIKPAIDLYLQQAASGDPSAIVSLRWTAALALSKAHGQLPALAADSSARRVITAYIIAGGFRDRPVSVDSTIKTAVLDLMEKGSAKSRWVPAPKPGWRHYAQPVELWLNALETAKVKDIEAAEQIALAAYQVGDLDRAGKWLNLAGTTPLAQWLQAKLYLRDGKTVEAAALLAQLCRSFPIVSPETNSHARLTDSLYVQIGAYNSDRISVAQELAGEMGVFRLARRQYIEALDALARSGYWIDTAYVAEHVLTLEELRAYVDREWPRKVQPAGLATARVNGESEDTAVSQDPLRPTDPGDQLRYLLARRLARAGRRVEARPYYPPERLALYDEYCAAVRRAEDPQTTMDQQASAYWVAAQIARTNGLELLGTEVEPDWAVHEGNYREGVTVADRAGLAGTNALTASSEELSRARTNAPHPDLRFHYRYTAADLALEAAKRMPDKPDEMARMLDIAGSWFWRRNSDSEAASAFYQAATALAWDTAARMPDNSDATARLLCRAGSWIKARDPKAADVFYKALVRRCRKTAIGDAADRLRWFPQLDEDGNLGPKKKPQPLREAADDGEG